MSQEAWRLRYAGAARRDLRRLDPQIRDRVLSALERLAAGEPTPGERKLKGRDEWRLRVGDWRVRFERDVGAREIVVLRILPRGRAYER